MTARALRQNEQAERDEGRNQERRQWAAEGKAAQVSRLVEEISPRSAEWPRRDEGGPEQRHARHASPAIRAATTASAAVKISAPPLNPRPASSAIQSPRAVPRVCEKVMAA